MTDYTIAVLEDAITILELLQNHSEGMSLAQIAGASGFVKNKVFRILYTLEKQRLVERDRSGCYRLGLRLLEFGQTAQRQTGLLEVSNPVMDWLVQETHESIFLGVISGGDALCLAARESPRSIRLFAGVGRLAPLHSGGVPKILFAFLPDDERRSLIDRFVEQFAESTAPFDGQMLESQLQQIRDQGYAIVVDELDVGAHSVAAPIRDYAGQVIAALSIAGPSHRFTEENVSRYVQLVIDGAQQISQLLGYKVPTQPMSGLRTYR